MIEFSGGTFWGHSVSKLLEALQQKLDIPEQNKKEALSLDKFYIPTRYPNRFDSGARVDYYTLLEAQAAYDAAKSILSYCESHFSKS